MLCRTGDLNEGQELRISRKRKKSVLNPGCRFQLEDVSTVLAPSLDLEKRNTNMMTNNQEPF